MTSAIEVISKPRPAKDLIADSLPEPTPLTKTLIFWIPIFLIVCVNPSAILEAAKGVDFLVPLKPMDPADDQAKTFPLASVRVRTVLL